jgi:hypothetical protein
MEEKTDKLFVKGFNDGYTIEEGKPDFMSRMIKTITSSDGNPYIEGLMEGHKQRKKELELAQIKQSIERGNGHDKGNERDLSR